MIKIEPRGILAGVIVLKVEWASEDLVRGVSDMNLGLTILIIQEPYFRS